jgi:hypothetical protein
MTDWGYNDDNSANLGNDTELTGPKALRDAYDAMKKQNDELNQKLTSFLEEQAQQKMATVFESLGVPGAQAAYTGPNDPAKAKEWVESMRSVFGGGNQGANPNVAEQQVEQPGLAPDAAAQYQRMTEAGQSGTPVTSTEAAFQAVGNATDINDLIAQFQNATRTQ